MNYNAWAKFCFVVLGYSFPGLKAILSQDSQLVSACYGIKTANFMSIECEADTIIALKDVRAMAKLKSTGCPKEDTYFTPAEEFCCRHEDNDCGVTYTGPVRSQYFSLCQGRNKCSMLQPAWEPLTDFYCNTSLYLETTNYMELEYQCFSTQSTASPCASISVTDASTILWNDGFPSVMQPKQNGCSCSVEVSCDTSIRIETLDVRFINDNGACKQGVVITEGTKTNRLGCESNNNDYRSVVYTSSSPFLTFKLLNDYSTYGGLFWFEISGSLCQFFISRDIANNTEGPQGICYKNESIPSSENASLTLSCGELMHSTPKIQETKKCTGEDTTTVVTTTTTLSYKPATTVLMTTKPETTVFTTKTDQNTGIHDSNTTGAGYNTSFTDTATASITSATAERSNGTTNNDNATMTHNDTMFTDGSSTSDYNTLSTIYYKTNNSSVSSNISSSSREGHGFTTPSNSQENTTIHGNTLSGNNTNNWEDSESSTEERTTIPITDGTRESISNTVTATETGKFSTDDEKSDSTTDSQGTGEDLKEWGSNQKTPEEPVDGDGMTMTIIIIAVIVALLLILFLLLCFNRRKIKELLCGEKTKNEVESEDDRSESPPKYDTMPDFPFSAGGSPIINSIPAGSTELLFRKLPDIGASENGLIDKKDPLQPILSKIPTERRLPPVSTKLLSKIKTRKTQKLGFLNMIMVEKQNHPLPRLNPGDIEGGIKESYGALSHATTDSEVIEKGRKNVERNTKTRKKKRKLMERLHGHTVDQTEREYGTVSLGSPLFSEADGHRILSKQYRKLYF